MIKSKMMVLQRRKGKLNLRSWELKKRMVSPIRMKMIMTVRVMKTMKMKMMGWMRMETF